MSTALKAAQAAGSHWGLAAKSCIEALTPLPDAANLGFVYVTEGFADDLSSIVTFLRETTPVQHWLGGVGYGILGPDGEVQEGRALTLMVGHVADEALRPFSGFDPANPDDFLAEHGDWLSSQSMVTGLVHGDAREPHLGEMIAGLAAAAPAFLVGGLTAASEAPTHVAGRVVGAGLSGALFGDGAPLVTGLSQGCQPIGPVHRVTEVVDNVVMGLDGQAALDLLKEEAGDIIARDLKRAAGYIHVAQPIEGSDNPHDYVVRSLLGIDPKRGWLAVGGHLVNGDRLMFVRRDPNAARHDLNRMLDGLAARIGDRPIKGGVYVSCVARGAHMFGHEGAESEMIHDSLGDFPLIGFSASGEICHDRLYGYTGVLLLFL